jgi:hypothetical protein
MTRVVISSAADADTGEILAYLIRHAGLSTAARYNSRNGRSRIAALRASIRATHSQ